MKTPLNKGERPKGQQTLEGFVSPLDSDVAANSRRLSVLHTPRGPSPAPPPAAEAEAEDQTPAAEGGQKRRSLGGAVGSSAKRRTSVREVRALEEKATQALLECEAERERCNTLEKRLAEAEDDVAIAQEQLITTQGQLAALEQEVEGLRAELGAADAALAAAEERAGNAERASAEAEARAAAGGERERGLTDLLHEERLCTEKAKEAQALAQARVVSLQAALQKKGEEAKRLHKLLEEARARSGSSGAGGQQQLQLAPPSGQQRKAAGPVRGLGPGKAAPAPLEPAAVAVPGVSPATVAAIVKQYKKLGKVWGPDRDDTVPGVCSQLAAAGIQATQEQVLAVRQQLDGKAKLEEAAPGRWYYCYAGLVC